MDALRAASLACRATWAFFCKPLKKRGQAGSNTAARLLAVIKKQSFLLDSFIGGEKNILTVHWSRIESDLIGLGLVCVPVHATRNDIYANILPVHDVIGLGLVGMHAIPCNKEWF
jgi:hypothetical protein